MIKVLLIAALVAGGIAFMRGRAGTRARAGNRVLFSLFLGFSIVAVIDPELTTSIAKAVGVGRGADLLLYALCVAFLFVTVNLHLRLKDAEQRSDALAREIALSTARRPGSGDAAQP